MDGSGWLGELKVRIVRPFEYRPFRSGIINWRLGNFYFNFNDAVSRDELKTLQGGLRISEMALYNQRDFTASHLIRFCKSCEMLCD